MSTHDFDLPVIGSGPAGHHAAVEAAISASLSQLDGSTEVLRNTVFNYPWLAEAYRIAATSAVLLGAISLKS